ncbi:MAG: hypothetical protein P8Y93_10095, partial [Acidobacteriota bacterium]
LALGAESLILDVKWGRGAFRQTVDGARELAAALRQVARQTGMRAEALITDMNQPLGPALGTACEVHEAIAVLDGRGDSKLREVTLRLCREAMIMKGWEGPRADEVLARALADGSAKARWIDMVEAHGGDPDPERLARPRAIREVSAPTAGFVRSCAADELGQVAAEVGAGRRAVDDELAHGAGVLVHGRLGDRVEAGQPLASLLVGEREIDEAHLVDRLRQAWEIGPEPVDPPQLILGTVDDVAEN